MIIMIGGLARVLLATVAGGRSVRDVAAISGLTSSPTHRHLTVLRELGLVTWREGASGTLRPLVAMRPVDGLSAVERAEIDREVREDRARDAAGAE